MAGEVPIDRPAEAGNLRTLVTRPSVLSWVALSLMTVSSVASLRTAPTMAVYGLASVFLYVVPALIFLVPTALVAAELASGWPGGVYRWVSEGFSHRLGLLAVWCQFAMTIFYYPAVLGYVASTLAYVYDPALAANGLYTGAVIVVAVWASILVSVRGGVAAIASLSSGGLVIGTLIPGALLVLLGLAYLLQGNAPAAPDDVEHVLPAFTGVASLVLIVNTFLCYSGMEMNAVHVSRLRRPGREYPRAMLLATVLALAIFILPTLAISWVIPAEHLSLTAGVMQAFSSFFAHFGAAWPVPLIAVALVAAALGGLLTWLTGPATGLALIAGEAGYLPPFLQRLNAVGVPQNLLILQGIVTTFIAVLYAFLPDVSESYWILSVISTQIYLVVHALLFGAAWRLRRHQPEHERGFRAPWLGLLCVVGLMATVAAFLIGFVPPSQFGEESALVYVGLMVGGTIVGGLLPAWLMQRLRRPGWRAGEVPP